MSVDLVAFGCRFFSTKPTAVVLSVWIGVGGCVCPISIKVCLAGIACLEFRKRAPISASAADDITFFMICAMFKTAALFAGSSSLFDKKKMASSPAFCS